MKSEKSGAIRASKNNAGKNVGKKRDKPLESRPFTQEKSFLRSGGEIIRFFERKKSKGKRKFSEWSRVGSGVEWGSGRRRVEKGKTGTTTFLSLKP